jgi:hypothetical protein
MLGAFGLFGTLFLLFCRYLPMIAIAEVKATMPQANPHWSGYAAHDDHGHAGGSAKPSFASPDALRSPGSGPDGGPSAP